MDILRFFGFGKKADAPGSRIEREASSIYGRLSGTAGRYGYMLHRATVSPGAAPCALFLGNHSSGKSTMINHLAGGEPLQDTGVAPTDDGFTILMFGEEEGDFVGESALARLPAEFAGLSGFGFNLVQRIRLKIRNREILRKTMLVDSPGMIDTAGAAAQRDYDFFGAVEFFANLADLVLLMFDPDKPGTTGESISALAGPLSGMAYKLRILMNKCDLFESMYDYARAYGALCWNLAHALPVKDLPKVYACYVPAGEKPSKLDLSDFDRLRGELEGQLADAGSSRRDNVVAATRGDVERLAMHVRMASRFRREMNRTVRRTILATFAVGALSFAFPVVFFRACISEGGFPAVLAWLVAASACILAVWIASLASSRFVKMRAAELLGSLDALFEDEFRDDLALRPDGALRQDWERVRGPLAAVLKLRWSKIPPSFHRALRKIDDALESLADASAALAAIAVSVCCMNLSAMDVEDDGEHLIVERGRATAIFSKASGMLERMNLRGSEIFSLPSGGVVAGPKFVLAPAAEGTSAAMAGREGFRLFAGEDGFSGSVALRSADGRAWRCTVWYCFGNDDSVAVLARIDPLHLPRYCGSRYLAQYFEPELSVAFNILPRYEIKTDDGFRHKFADSIGRGVVVTAPCLAESGGSITIPLCGSRVFATLFESARKR